MSEQTIHTFTEAPASWNIRYRNNGRDEQITIRGNSYAEIVKSIDAARDYVKAHSDTMTPIAKITDAINTEAELTGQVPAGEMVIHTEPKPQPSGATESFEADELTITMIDGQQYTKVKGGQFKKFGVTVWPEVLTEAGIGKLDPAKSPYGLRGYTAYFNRKEDGKPGKVVKLVKAQAA